ncbi:Bicarbonate transport system permease protein CmpB [Aquisphaera giovannonii]|uniref:Bicarbonate transport system permease protein CmpB n=2 Tax=Aquisphaera giovannonii TaxID=406548 RepID=A0A5B9W816_9BACT|nr:Bicarbonate transport system permease protein CmpB [Aquisphaera giovannonii]
MGLLGIAACFGIWWFVTRGEAEERILSPSSGISSPSETFATFHSLWFDRALTRNLLTSLRRVASGFGLATAVGVPLGILCGCFTRVDAFFLPVTVFGRNIPVAALIPLTFSLFGIGELQKTMFIFIACVAFIVSDTARSIREVRESYVDSAYTLGAGRWQAIMKVLVPLALPGVFNSLRLLFSLAFGYIMLAEVVKFGGESGGLGDIINTSQRRGPREHVVLVLLIIPVVALAIDKALLWIQRELFPYRYGGVGVLHSLVRALMHGWEDLKGLVWRRPLPASIAGELAGPPQARRDGQTGGPRT